MGAQIGFIISNNTVTTVIASGRVGRCTYTTQVINLSIPISHDSFTVTRDPLGEANPGFTFSGTLSGTNASGTVVIHSGDNVNCPGSSNPYSWTATNAGAGMPLVPGVPGGFTVFVFGRSINVDWLAPSAGGTPTGYTVEIGTTQGSTNVGSVDTTQRAINIPMNPGTYFTRVRARNASGPGLASPDQTFTIH